MGGDPVITDADTKTVIVSVKVETRGTSERDFLLFDLTVPAATPLASVLSRIYHGSEAVQP